MFETFKHKVWHHSKGDVPSVNCTQTVRKMLINLIGKKVCHCSNLNFEIQHTKRAARRVPRSDERLSCLINCCFQFSNFNQTFKHCLIANCCCNRFSVSLFFLSNFFVVKFLFANKRKIQTPATVSGVAIVAGSRQWSEFY